MTQPPELVEIWRGPLVESVHRGHAVICDADGGRRGVGRSQDHVVLPRSSAKMIQALPLVESGAADAHALTSRHLALACASHNAADIHTRSVLAWLDDLGLSESDLRCGPQEPDDIAARNALIRAGRRPARSTTTVPASMPGFSPWQRAHLGGRSRTT